MRRRDFIAGLIIALVSPLLPVDFINGNDASARAVTPFIRMSPRELAAAMVATNKKRRETRQREVQKQSAA
jgi:hypothetical protein